MFRRILAFGEGPAVTLQDFDVVKSSAVVHSN